MIGIEEKDMIINRIPAKTWNHLHMNQSRVGEVVINRTGELNASVNDVSLIDDGKLNNGELDNIIGGCGQELSLIHIYRNVCPIQLLFHAGWLFLLRQYPVSYTHLLVCRQNI